MQALADIVLVKTIKQDFINSALQFLMRRDATLSASGVADDGHT